MDYNNIEEWLDKIVDMSYDNEPQVIINELDKILAIDSCNIKALNFKADMLEQLGNKKESYEISKFVLELEPDNAEAGSIVYAKNFNFFKLLKASLKKEWFVYAIYGTSLIFAPIAATFMLYGKNNGTELIAFIRLNLTQILNISVYYFVSICIVLWILALIIAVQLDKIDEKKKKKRKNKNN